MLAPPRAPTRAGPQASDSSPPSGTPPGPPAAALGSARQWRSSPLPMMPVRDEGTPVDLYAAACRLERAQERYSRWRELRAALAAIDAASPLPGWVGDACDALGDDAAPATSKRPSAGSSRRRPPSRTTSARPALEHWYQQGKALRYALVLCRNRLESLGQEMQTAPPPGPPAAPRTLAMLRDQVRALAEEIGLWQQRRTSVARICTLLDLERLLADPAHPRRQGALGAHHRPCPHGRAARRPSLRTPQLGRRLRRDRPRRPRPGRRPRSRRRPRPHTTPRPGRLTPQDPTHAGTAPARPPTSPRAGRPTSLAHPRLYALVTTPGRSTIRARPRGGGRAGSCARSPSRTGAGQDARGRTGNPGRS